MAWQGENQRDARDGAGKGEMECSGGLNGTEKHPHEKYRQTCLAAQVEKSGGRREKHLRMPVLHDCVSRVDDRAVHVEEEAIKRDPLRRRRKGRVVFVYRAHDSG